MIRHHPVTRAEARDAILARWREDLQAAASGPLRPLLPDWSRLSNEGYEQYLADLFGGTWTITEPNPLADTPEEP